jgi:hypothetical protein
MPPVRTTLSVDEGLLRNLEEVAHEVDCDLKDVIDKALRAGLEGMRRGPRRVDPPGEDFVVDDESSAAIRIAKAPD